MSNEGTAFSLSHRGARLGALALGGDDSGFTLIEIMVVVGILAILLFIAVPSWRGARLRTQTRVCVGQLREIGHAKEAWALDKGRAGSDEPTFGDLCPEFLKTQPQCPESGTYTINIVDISPVCSIGGTHVWP